MVPDAKGLFFKLYGEQPQEYAEEELEWVSPESEGDVQAMLNELRKTGWAG